MIYVLTVIHGSRPPKEMNLRLTNGLAELWAACPVPAESEPDQGVLEFEFQRRPLMPELFDWIRRVAGASLLGAWCHGKNDTDQGFSWEKPDG